MEDLLGVLSDLTQESLQYMGFWMVVVACRKIGLAFEFHFIICRSSSNLEED